MKKTPLALAAFIVAAVIMTAPAHAAARNPIIHADVPDMAMIRVGGTYYMSSTTMHMSPGVPIMKSTDLVNWSLVNYACDRLDNEDALNLANGKSAYGNGSWASSLRYHDGRFYISTFSNTTGKTYVFTTSDIERGPWKTASFNRRLHDHSLFFDDDRCYIIHGGGKLTITELLPDASDVKPGGIDQIIIENAGALAGLNPGLPAEGSQLFKFQGRYYLFNITWPKGGMRTVLIHRADHITGPYEGRVALQDQGVAQGGLIDTPQGDWYAYLFRDSGAVGRIPYLVQVKWEDGWPVLGVEGKAPDTLEKLPASTGLIPGIVASDDFERRAGDRLLPLVWQWNHHPDNTLWSLTARPGFLRLTTDRIDADFLLARNTLTQRTLGPGCSGSTVIDVSNMKDGDVAGLALLQKHYGLVGVKSDGSSRFVVAVSAQPDSPVETARVPLAQTTVFLKADCDFRNRADLARFFYSLDGKTWTRIGSTLKMAYTLPHFMGYRFGLFNYATKLPGGSVDFDYFHIEDALPTSN
jgi:beta-xylosidase